MCGPWPTTAHSRTPPSPAQMPVWVSERAKCWRSWTRLTPSGGRPRNCPAAQPAPASSPPLTCSNGQTEYRFEIWKKRKRARGIDKSAWIMGITTFDYILQQLRVFQFLLVVLSVILLENATLVWDLFIDLDCRTVSAKDWYPDVEAILFPPAALSQSLGFFFPFSDIKSTPWFSPSPKRDCPTQQNVCPESRAVFSSWTFNQNLLVVTGSRGSSGGLSLTSLTPACRPVSPPHFSNSPLATLDPRYYFTDRFSLCFTPCLLQWAL